MMFLYQFLFGCFHGKTTFPMTIRTWSGGVEQRRTYVACLNCGEELEYNWDKMKIQGAAKAGRELRTTTKAIAIK